MAATLKLTAASTAELDLSTYLNVQEDGGLDPADGGFLEPAFNDSSVGAGQALVNIDAANKEQIYPLMLKAASKDALHALVQSIRRKLDEPGVRVEWRDHNATLSTFYDLEYGRLEIGYRYFRARQNWAAATLHLWTRPYGHTATERLVASIVASGHGAPVLLVGSLAGDVGALARYTVTIASYAAGTGDNDAVIAAVLPSPSYPFRTPAASMALTGATRIGASGAAGSQYLAKLTYTTGVQILTSVVPPIPTAMGGRHRVLAIVKGGQNPAVGMYAADSQKIVGSVLLTGSQWTLADFGVWSVPSHIAGGIGGKLDFIVNPTAGGSGALVGSYRWSINEIYLVPEDSACAVKTTDHSLYRWTIDAINNTFVNSDPLTVGGGYDIAGSLRGQPPAIPPAATVAIGVLRAPISVYGTGGGLTTVAPNASITAEIRVRERVSFQR